VSLGRHYLTVVGENFRYLKQQAERAMAQLDDDGWHWAPDAESNSVAVLVQHLGGNMLSRWTDFLTSDGEKPDRDRDAEFVDAGRGRAELLAVWERGWRRLFETLAALDESDLARTVTIRGEPHTVVQALQRSLWHYAEHVGQIIYIAKALRGEAWQTLSIPRKR
jgi:uncharacterized damage-inducible protein DinB